MEISGSITGSTGEWVIATFDGFGKFEGPIIRVNQRGFAIRIVTTLDGRKNIDGKIAWLEKKGPEKRRYERLIPADPSSIMYLPNGQPAHCKIIDYSMSGAAVAAETDPPSVGAIVIIGKIPGLVARTFAEGFAVEFLSIRNPRDIEELFSLNSSVAP